jgi:NADH-quinone oxidoreductase subunit B
MAVDESDRTYEHPLYQHVEHMPGVSIAMGRVDQILTWGTANSLWVFPMATSCCGIEFMAAACSRFDMDRIGTVARGTPRQCDVMVIAGTITVKMAPRVKRLWDQMPEPKWSIAMGSCAISGDFYRDIYSVVPGVDTFMQVDVYVPGCPPNPDALLMGFRRLQEKIEAQRKGVWVEPELRPDTYGFKRPEIGRLQDADRDPSVGRDQLDRVVNMGYGGEAVRAGAFGEEE